MLLFSLSFLPGTPGLLILDELETRGIPYSEFVSALGEDRPAITALLNGEFIITDAIADKISVILDVPAYMLVPLESSFRNDWRNRKMVPYSPLGGAPGLNDKVESSSTPEKKPNGNLSLRIPKTLHERAVKKAKDEGVSLNQLLTTYVAEGLARAG